MNKAFILIHPEFWLNECTKKEIAPYTLAGYPWKYSFKPIEELPISDFILNCDETDEEPKKFIYSNVKKI